MKFYLFIGFIPVLFVLILVGREGGVVSFQGWRSYYVEKGIILDMEFFDEGLLWCHEFGRSL